MNVSSNRSHLGAKSSHFQAKIGSLTRLDFTVALIKDTECNKSDNFTCAMSMSLRYYHARVAAKGLIYNSGQTETVSVRVWPKISAKICFGFGILAFYILGDSPKTLFLAEIVAFGQKIMFCPDFGQKI